jgi:hypothetical protein
MRRWGLLFVLIVGVAGCGGAQRAVTTTVVQTVPPPPPTTSSTSSRPKPPPPTPQLPPPQSYVSYSALDYTLDRPAGWITIEDQRAAHSYLESKWRDPADSKTSVLIDSQPSPGLSAQLDAESVRAQTSSTPGYQEISFEPASIGGNDAWRWVFNVSGTERVDYFINACGHSFAILGTTTPQRFDQLAGAFQHIADSVQPNCTPTRPPPPTTPTTTTSVPTTPAYSCPTESGVPRENDCPPADPANPDHSVTV